ncbi:MAG: hypothetical protein ACYSO4_00525 [Planctomycetota bacterium]|jgi:hypothetical protein
MYQKEEFLIINDYPKSGDAIFNYAYSNEQRLYFHALDELREYSSCGNIWNDALVEEIPELEIHIPFLNSVHKTKYSIFSTFDNLVCDKLCCSSSFRTIISPIKLTKDSVERILSEISTENMDVLREFRKFDSCDIANAEWLYFMDFVHELSFSFFFARNMCEIENFKTIISQSSNVDMVSLQEYKDWFYGRKSKKIQENLSSWPKRK